jgi:membrane-bound lytic murein transglycosylase D
VAREFHVTESELATANQLHASDSIQGVEALVVPAAPIAASAHMLLYTARRGDTLVTIADRFGVSLTQLRLWNKMTGIKVAPGMRLHIAEPSVASSTHRRAGAGSSGASAKTAKTDKGSAHRAAPHSAKRKATSTASAAPSKTAHLSTKSKHPAPSTAKKKQAAK